MSRFVRAFTSIGLCFVWYFLSSATAQMTKIVLLRYSHPLLLAQVQCCTSAFFSFAVIQLSLRFPILKRFSTSGSLSPIVEHRLFEKKTLFFFLPLGIVSSLGKFASLSATSYVPVATVVSVKALSPLLIVFGCRILYNVRVSALTCLSLLILTAGVILIVSEDAVDSMNLIEKGLLNGVDAQFVKGLVYSWISVSLMAAQQICGRNVVTREQNYDIEKARRSEKKPTDPYRSSEQRAQPEKLTVVFYTSVIGFCISSAGSISTKAYKLVVGDDSVHIELATDSVNAFGVTPLIVVLSLCQFAQTLVYLFLLGSLSAISFSVASMMKRVVVITIGLLMARNPLSEDTERWFGKMTKAQASGLLLVACGLYIYRISGYYPTNRPHG